MNLLLVGLGWLAQGEAPRTAQIEWLREHAVPLVTVEAGNGFEDLEPLRAVIGDARVVGLGESTHGSREQFQLKHRLVEFLVSEMGFDTFSIEASMPESYRVDDYVTRGEGDPVQLIRGMYFWTWSTEEVLAMVEWMRAFNRARPDGGVRFTGFDMQTPDVAASIVAEGLAPVDPEHSELVRELYDEIMFASTPRRTWTSATGSLDPATIAGREVVFRGRIRTAGVEGAALWFRADLERTSVAFQNTESQHVEGEGWTEHRIRLEIPEEIDNVNFGLIHSGAGTTWFDDLHLTLDGEPWDGGDRFDLEMEEDGRGFWVAGSDYAGTIDREVACSGESSFRMRRVTPLATGPDTGAADAHEAASGVLADLEEMEDALALELGAERASWIVQMARVVDQCMASRAGSLARDRAMADNVLWMLEQDPEAKIVLWAHNGHIGNEGPAMGAHLEQALGDDYLAVGFATSRGEYRAVSADRSGLSNHALIEPPAGSIESFFDAAGLELAALDLRRSVLDSPESGWLHEARPMRSIGAVEMDPQFFPTRAFPKFEVLLHTGTTSAAWPLRARWSDAPPDGR